MKKNLGYLIFLVVFLLLCLFPLVGMAITGPSGSVGNEILSAPPSLTKAGGFNPSFLSDASDYFADHFAARQELITANARLEAALFGESAEEKVILGKDGWLYYKSTLDDYRGQNLLADREIWSAAHCLALMQEYAQAQNVDFLFAVAPNKNTLYPEHMPDRYLRSDATGNLAHLYDALQQEGVQFADLKAAFDAEDSTLYYRLDSHWNELGAALAHDTILDALGKDAPRLYDPDQFTEGTHYNGDLDVMLYPLGSDTDVDDLPNWDWYFSISEPFRGAEDQMIQTRCAERSGSLLMFRDSFGNSLYPYMADSFFEARFSRAMPYDLSLLDGADTLIVEIVERNIDWLAQRAPILPAPVRELALPKTCDPAAQFTCGFTQTDGGTVCCSGNLGCAPDTDSPIYLVCDGTVYEASPAGSGELPFTAYLPAQPATLQIMFYRNGTLVISQTTVC